MRENLFSRIFFCVLIYAATLSTKKSAKRSLSGVAWLMLYLLNGGLCQSVLIIGHIINYNKHKIYDIILIVCGTVMIEPLNSVVLFVSTTYKRRKKWQKKQMQI